MLLLTNYPTSDKIPLPTPPCALISFVKQGLG